jgi:methionine synthase II (cobalamin-independent)
MIEINVNDFISEKFNHPEEVAEKLRKTIEKEIKKFKEKFPNEEIFYSVSVGIGEPERTGDYIEVFVNSENSELSASKIKSEISFVLSEIYSEDVEDDGPYLPELEILLVDAEDADK